MNTIFENKESVDYKKLAEMVQNGQVKELNDKPLYEGPYKENFSIEGWNYTFESDGSFWNWEYRQVGY